MDIFLGVLVGLVVLTLLVTIHELGHFIMARLSKVKVTEFGLGFPPRIVGWVKRSGKWRLLTSKSQASTSDNTPAKSPKSTAGNNTIVSLNWLPLGGFCAMFGESASDTRPGSFGAASFLNKTKILFGGVLANWLTAFIILTILALTGMPKFLPDQFFLDSDLRIKPGQTTVVKVEPDSPAGRAGFQIGDLITKVNDKLIIHSSDLTLANQQFAGQATAYTVIRDSKEQVLTATLNTPEQEAFLLGIAYTETAQPRYYATWSAPLVGAATTVQLTTSTFKGFGEMLYNLSSGLIKQLSFNQTTREAGQQGIAKAGQAVSGPIGIIGVIFPAFTATGLTNLAFLTAVISVSLACMNILPIPVLDGGRWLMITIFRLRKKPLTPELESRILSRAFIAILALIFIITIIDITRFFG